METLKVGFLWVHSVYDMQNSVFFHLLKKQSKKKIEIAAFDKADILIIGPYDFISFKRKALNYFLKKKIFKNLSNYFNNIELYSLKRKYKPVRIFISYENIHHSLSKIDFSFNHNLGIVGENYFRFPHWKDNLDWTHEGISRDITLTSKRFGFFWKIEDLINPQGSDFIKKSRNFCIFTSHMNEPRKSIYSKFKEHFRVDGYGPWFDKKITDHNKSDFTIYEVMKNYAFNLCPENSLYPGYYTERVPNAVISKTLPITWADQNISLDFNERSFVNLLDYTKDNYQEICAFLKDENFLKQFAHEPLLLKRPDLNDERLFVSKILSLFQ